MIMITINIIVNDNDDRNPIQKVISNLFYRFINYYINFTKNAKSVNPKNIPKVIEAAINTYSGF
jgi:hypothetical protein